MNTKYFFHNTNGQLKTGKMGTHLSADTSPVQCSLSKSMQRTGYVTEALIFPYNPELRKKIEINNFPNLIYVKSEKIICYT